MPFTTLQLQTGANYALEGFQREDPIDQINTEHATLDWLIANKRPSSFSNGLANEPVFMDNGANYQNYFGADQVTYNERDPDRWAKFSYYNNHDGFWFDEDRLAAAGIIIDDSNSTSPTGNEREQLLDMLKQSYVALKASIQANLALELLRDGTQSSKACPGLDFLVSTTPNVGVIGNIDAGAATWWRNNANLAIATGVAGTLTTAMQASWRATRRFGKMKPDFIVCGAAFADAYRKDAPVTINRQIILPQKNGGITIDNGYGDTSFKGVPMIEDPDFETLDAVLGAITYPYTKRCYFLNSKTIALRPVKGAWMMNRKPARPPDRYVHYFGQTSKYGMTTNKRNANAVLSIA